MIQAIQPSLVTAKVPSKLTAGTHVQRMQRGSCAQLERWPAAWFMGGKVLPCRLCPIG